MRWTDKRRISRGAVILATISLIPLAFLLLPVGVLVWRGVEMRGWLDVTANVWAAIRISLYTTVWSTVLTLLFGTPLALALVRWRSDLKRSITPLIELPIVLPPAVAGLALLLTFGRLTPIGMALDSIGIQLPFSTTAVIIGQIFIAAPFYIRAAMVGFGEVDREIEDAARVDGASEIEVFWYVLLPLARRALAAGLVLSWARAVGEFGATILFAGSRVGETQTMPMLVYREFERDLNAAIWTGVLLVAMALLALLTSQWLLREKPA